MIRRLWLPLLALSCTGGASGTPGQAQCLGYEPETVRLEGTLAIEPRYGPPNYGETPDIDQKVQVPIVKLAHPIDVCSEPTAQLNTESFTGISEIQLVVEPADATTYASLVGQRIAVVGSLSEALTGHHYTKVVLSVDSIAPREDN